jgi:hypothetical protein
LQAGGGIAFVASVAGYRGLPKALAYGPGKAALINFAECPASRSRAEKHRRLGDQPRLRRYPLTAQNDFAMPALLTPEAGGNCCGRRLPAAGNFEIHFPKRFTRLMKFMALLPYGLVFPLDSSHDRRLR